MKKRNRRRSLAAAGILCAATASLISTVHAAVTNVPYTFGGSSGTWTIASAWSGGVPAGGTAGNGANAILPSTHVGSYTVSFGTQFYSTVQPLNTIHISASTGTTADLIQNNSASAMAAIEEHIGLDGGTGQYDQGAGTNTVTSTGAQLGLQVGENFPGIYNLSGGTLTVPNSQEIIGSSSAGTFTQNGGVNLASYMFIGNLAGSSGFYSLAAGSLTVTTNAGVGLGGTGVFLQTGGTNNVGAVGSFTQLYLGGGGNGSSGTYLLGSGTVSSGAVLNMLGTVESIGAIGGVGNFIQSGGMHNVGSVAAPSAIDVGAQLGSGTYSLGNGTGSCSAALNVFGAEAIGGPSAHGNFIQTGGTHNVGSVLASSTLSIGNGGIGTYSLGNGTLGSSAALNVFGTEILGVNGGAASFIQTGGTHNLGSASATVASELDIGAAGSAGTYSLRGGGILNVYGNVYVGGDANGGGGPGLLAISAGTMTVIGTIKVWDASGASLNFTGGSISTGSIDTSGNPSRFIWTAGSLTMNNSLSLVANGFLAQSSNLTALKSLTVPGTTTGDGSQPLVLTGGTFSTGSISSAGLVQFSSGTFQLTSASLTVGVSGLFGPTLQLGANQHIDISNGPVTVDPGALIVLTSPSATLSGGTLTNNGTLNGSGQIANNLTNSSLGLVRVSGTDWLRFAGASNTNNGQITLLNGGEADFGGPLTNSASGVISGRGVLGVTGGLTNNGQIQFSGGFTDVFGAVSNNGRITVTGGSTTTFYNAVNTSAGSITVNSNSTAVFLGNLTGQSKVQTLGNGTLDFETTHSGGPIVASLGNVLIGPGSTGTSDSITANSLAVYGTTSITPSGAAANVSRVNSLFIAGGQLDLNNNDLIVDYAGISPLTSIASAIASGYNAGSWNGEGIASTSASMNPGAHKMALGYAEASTLGITSFDGQTVDNSSALIGYTYSGDANLDGNVNALDFNALATNFGSASGGFWSQGDFNYDGVVNTADFMALSQNFGQVLPSPTLESLVPEPSIVVAILVPLLSRRRRYR